MQRSAMIKEIQLIFLTKQPPLGGKGYIFMSNCRTEKKKKHGTCPQKMIKLQDFPRNRAWKPMSQGLTIVAKSHVWREKSQKATFVVRLSGCHRVFYIKDQLAAPSTCFPFKSISSYFSCTSWHKCSALLEKKRDDQRYVTYADAVVISLHLLHRAINTRKVCNDTQTHAQTRARNFRIINH